MNSLHSQKIDGVHCTTTELAFLGQKKVLSKEKSLEFEFDASLSESKVEWKISRNMQSFFPIKKCYRMQESLSAPAEYGKFRDRSDLLKFVSVKLRGEYQDLTRTQN